MTLPSTIIADDHTMMVDGLRRLLHGHADIVATCSDGESLLASTLRLRPQLVITDLSMPSLTGLAFLLKAREAGVDAQVIVLSMHTEWPVVSAAFAAGASGYLPKHSAGEELLDAMSDVLAGNQYLSPLIHPPVEHVNAGNGHLDEVTLTSRQQEVLKAIAAGKRMKEIASELGLSRRTVEMHKYRMMRSLGVRTTAQLVQYYMNSRVDAVLEHGSADEEIGGWSSGD